MKLFKWRKHEQHYREDVAAVYVPKVGITEVFLWGILAGKTPENSIMKRE